MQKRMFWAITALGWGSGDSVMTATENYLKAQRRNFPHLTQEDLEEAWGFVWLAPEGAEGFHHDPSGLWWHMPEGQDNVQPDYEQDRVAPIGKLPDSVFDAWRALA